MRMRAPADPEAVGPVAREPISVDAGGPGDRLWTAVTVVVVALAMLLVWLLVTTSPSWNAGRPGPARTPVTAEAVR